MNKTDKELRLSLDMDDGTLMALICTSGLSTKEQDGLMDLISVFKGYNHEQMPTGRIEVNDRQVVIEF